MTSKVVAYVAVSLDGFIAHGDGSVGFLERFGTDEYDFHGFLDTIGAVVLGAATYEQVLGWGWPYGDLPGVVLTSRDLPSADGANIDFSRAPTADAIRSLAASTDKRVWVVGGGVVITEGISGGAIDTLELYVMPTVLGSGVPLFTDAIDARLELVEAASFTNGVVKLEYRVELGTDT
jgi:dihydrofolate reductase